jgi:hypothetical protein
MTPYIFINPHAEYASRLTQLFKVTISVTHASDGKVESRVVTPFLLDITACKWKSTAFG